MKNVKKVLSVMLVLVVALGMLAGCGDKKDSAAGSSSADSAKASGDKYIIATDTTFAPFEFTNDQNEFVGIDLDILAAIAKDQGFEYELQSLGFDAAVAALESRQADGVIAGMSITPDRQKKYDFSEAYYDSTVCAAVKADSAATTLEDIKGSDVAVKNGTQSAAWAESIKDDNGNYYRYYPYGCTFAHVVGTSDVNKSGVELTADYNLITSDIQPVEKIINEIRGQKNPADNVVTTLDANLQQVAHDALGDREGAVVAIEPSTGKVLAMISKPDYDPNSLVDNYQDIISDENSKVLLNQSTQGLFVPGSIFKMVTSLAYLRSGGDPDNYSYYCDGSISLQSDSGDSYIKCYDGEEHGQVDLLESFAESCNASFANLGLSISVDKMNEVANSLLFNQTLPTKFTTAKSQFSLSNTDSQWQIGATAIGQGNTVISPIHAAMLVSAIANGGTLMKPYVIDSVQSTEGSVIEQYESENYGTLMSTSESSQLTKMMKAVVEEGTGYKLSGKNYSVAGKTGTAEVVGRGNNAWFVGFAPADDPKIAICVLVEDAGTASSEAVPIAGEILDAYLNN